jgi:hypothetical protein
MADYTKYMVYDPLTVKRREIEQTEAEDPGPRTRESLARYMGLSDFLQSRIATEQPGGWEVKHRLLNMEPAMLEGPTNFSSNPDLYFNPKARLQSISPRIQDKSYNVSPLTEGAVWPREHQRIFINPASQLSSTSSLLGHESAHTGHLGLDAHASMPSKYRTIPQEQLKWAPTFSQKFMEEAYAQTGQKISPYQFKSGFGKSQGGQDRATEETMAFLIGREAELPAGKTLLDDPQTRHLFENHPGMWEEYVKARDAIHRSWQPKKTQ